MDEATRRRLRLLLPEWISAYAEDSSIPQLINHLLLVMGCCNAFLLFASIRASLTVNYSGVHPLFLSALLSSQNAISGIVFNHARLPLHLSSQCSSLRPSDFMVGIILGTSIGASILSFVMSLFYGQMSKCVLIQWSTYEYLCDNSGIMLAIWFWSGLIFWLSAGIAVLVAVGRDELGYMAQHHYESIGISLSGGRRSTSRPTMDSSLSRNHDEVVEFEGDFHYSPQPERRQQQLRPVTSTEDSSLFSSPTQEQQRQIAVLRV